MSTVWETIALKHTGANVAGVSLISNMGCGLVKNEVLKHEDVEKEIRKVGPPLIKSLFSLGEHYAEL
jgi:purine nucleoside phosphorylase